MRKQYITPTYEVVNIKNNDILTESDVTQVVGNVFNGPVTGGHGGAMAPGRHRIWED